MSWFGGLFGATPAPGNSVLPVVNPPSPSTTFPLQQVVVVPKNNKPTPSSPVLNASPSTQGATAPRDPSPIHMNVRRGEYVALGGSRKSGKGRKSKKSSKAKKSKKASKAKKTKSRK